MQTIPHTTNPYGGGQPPTLSADERAEDLRIDRADAIASLAAARMECDEPAAAYWLSEIKRITAALDSLR